jgi:hypothetical protein
LTAEQGGKGSSAKVLENSPSSCFVYRSIFKIFGEEGAMRAGDLTMKALTKFAGDAGDAGEKSEEEEKD